MRSCSSSTLQVAQRHMAKLPQLQVDQRIHGQTNPPTVLHIFWRRWDAQLLWLQSLYVPWFTGVQITLKACMVYSVLPWAVELDWLFYAMLRSEYCCQISPIEIAGWSQSATADESTPVLDWLQSPGLLLLQHTYISAAD